MIVVLHLARGAVSLAIVLLNSIGAAFKWAACRLVPAQKLLTKAIWCRSKVDG